VVFETYWCNDKLSITVDFDNRMIPRHTFISNLKHNICKKLKTKSTVNTRFCCCKVYKYLSNIAHITINNALYQSTFYLLTYLLNIIRAKNHRDQICIWLICSCERSDHRSSDWSLYCSLFATSAAYAVMRCLSVHVSRSWTLSKRIKISSFFSLSGSHTILVFQYPVQKHSVNRCLCK